MPVIINSFISAALIVLLMYLDRYEKENIITMIKIFVISVLATGLYSFFQKYFPSVSYATSVVIIAPIMEELLKFITFIIIWKIWQKELNESFDAIMFIGMIAVGFAFYENIAYYMSATGWGAMLASKTSDFTLYRESLYRIFVARIIPGHLLFDTIAITIFGLHYKSKRSAIYLIPAYFTAVILHGFWNYLAESMILFTIYALILLLVAPFCVKKLLSVSEFRIDADIGNELREFDRKSYDWSYYVLAYILIIICGIIAIFFSYYLGVLLNNILPS